MKSDLPKVLFEICGRPMLDYVLDALAAGGIDRTIVVVGYRAELVEQAIAGRKNTVTAMQREQRGTGHAVMACREALAGYDGPLMIVTGDSPMMQASTIAALMAEFERTRPACLMGTIRKENPFGLGRVLRDAEGNFLGIVEQKDATPEQQKITEVNMSYYVFNCVDLLGALEHVRADNSQGEYYLTDAPGVLVAQGKQVRALCALLPCEAIGINTVDELAEAEAAMKTMTKEVQSL